MCLIICLIIKIHKCNYTYGWLTPSLWPFSIQWVRFKLWRVVHKCEVRWLESNLYIINNNDVPKAVLFINDWSPDVFKITFKNLFEARYSSPKWTKSVNSTSVVKWLGNLSGIDTTRTENVNNWQCQPRMSLVNGKSRAAPPTSADYVSRPPAPLQISSKTHTLNPENELHYLITIGPTS